MMMGGYRVGITGTAVAFLVFVAGAGVAGWGMQMKHIAVEAKSWPTVQGDITRSKLKIRDYNDRKGRRQREGVADIEYRYRVADRQYTSTRLLICQYGTSYSGHAQRRLKRYPQGAEVTVHYDPDRPGQAVLEPGKAGYAPLVAGLGFGLSGLSIIGYIAVAAINRKMSQPSSSPENWDQIQ